MHALKSIVDDLNNEFVENAFPLYRLCFLVHLRDLRICDNKFFSFNCFYCLLIFNTLISPLQDQLETLPEILTRCLAQHQERVETRRNFLHPDTANANSTPAGAQNPGTPLPTAPPLPPPTLGSPLILPHSR